MKKKIFSIIEYLPKTLQTNLFAILSNYVIISGRKGMENYIKYLFEIYRIGIEKEYSVKDGKIGFQTFSNTIIIAINLNKIEWAKKIIETKQYLLDDTIKEDCIKLAKANIAYAEKRYTDVLFELNTIQQFRHYSFGFQGRFVLLKTYFELALLGEKLGDNIYAFTDAYKYYLRRSKILGETQKKATQNVIRYTLKMLDNFYTRNIQWTVIRENIINSKEPIAGSSWLISKIDDFIDKKR